VPEMVTVPNIEPRKLGRPKKAAPPIVTAKRKPGRPRKTA